MAAEKINVFVCVAVWVCLSVGVGYWINENSIKWRDCSVMWSQTQEIWCGVITRLLLESEGCWFLFDAPPISICQKWVGIFLYSKSIREWSDMLLSRTSGQTFACDRHLDVLNVFFLFSFHVWLTITNTNYQLPRCVIIRSTGHSSFMKTKSLRSALKIHTISLVYGGKKESMQCLRNNLILADLWGAAYCVWLGQHVFEFF